MPVSRIAILSFFVGAACIVLAGPSSAGTDPASCVPIADDASRLACYDRALGRTAAPKAVPAAPAKSSPHGSGTAAAGSVAVAAPPPAPAASPAPKNPEAEFGLTETAKQRKDPAKAAEAAAVPEKISGRVISVQWRRYGEFVVTLDNGQVWEQNEPEPSAIVKVGDAVTVKKGWLGSFMLVTAGGVGTKVHRID